MKFSWARSLVTVAVIGLLPVPALSAVDGAPALSEQVTELTNATVASESVQLEALALPDTEIPVLLSEGRLYPVRTRDGTLVGGVFLGRGTLGDEPFAHAILRFSGDSATWADTLEFGPVAPQVARAATLWRARPKIDEITPHLFASALLRIDVPGAAYTYDDSRAQEHWLERGGKIIWRAYSASERSAHPPILLANKRNERYDLVNVTLTMRIDPKTETTADAMLTVRLRERADYLKLPLHMLATVDRVRSGGGDELETVRVGDSFVVALSRSAPAGALLKLRVEYRGPILEGRPAVPASLTRDGTTSHFLPPRRSVSTIYRPLRDWYPGASEPHRTRTDFTICTPESLTAAVSGRTKKRWKDGRRKQECVRSVSKEPLLHPSFVVGPFTCDTRRPRGLPRIRYCTLDRQDGSQIPRQAEEILLKYQKMFGPIPTREVEIAQIPFGAALDQGAPGLVLLPGRTWLNRQNGSLLARAEGRVFGSGQQIHDLGRSLATQWWGHQIGPKTPSDRWLLEALAEYTAGLHVEREMGTDAFRKLRRQWSQEAIAVGRARGAWVIHMLRFEMGYAKFFEALEVFSKLVGHRNASTEDFQAICEKVTGTSLTWFFDAWVNGQGIPRIEFTYQVSQSEHKKRRWDVTGTVRKDGIRSVIKVPVVVHYGAGRKQRVMVPVQGDVSPFRFTGLPAKPKRVTIDEDALLSISIGGTGK